MVLERWGGERKRDRATVRQKRKLSQAIKTRSVALVMHFFRKALPQMGSLAFPNSATSWGLGA